MKNVINLVNQPDGSPIQTLCLATTANKSTAGALGRLGFTELNGNIWAIIPKGLSKEECQEQIKQHPRPLVPVEGDPIVSLEEGLAWLDE